MINNNPNTNLKLDDLTENHIKDAFEIYRKIVGCRREYSGTGITIDYAKEQLSKNSFVDFRVSSNLSMQSKFVVELKSSGNNLYINFAYDSNIYPEPKEVVDLGLEFDKQVRKYFLSKK